MNEGQQHAPRASVSECSSRSFPGDGATAHPNFHRRQSCYIGLESPSLWISMISPRTVTGAQECFVACAIFTRAKIARGTIARRSVLEEEKNEPRGMPSPALAFMQNCSPNLSACWRSAPTVRLICFEIFAIGVLAFECFRSSACIALVQAAPRGLVFFFVALAICPPNLRRVLSRIAW